MSVAERDNANVVERPADDRVVTFACIVYLIGYAGYSFFGHRPDEPTPSEWAAIRFVTYLAPLVLLAPGVIRHAMPLNAAACAFLAAYLCLGYVDYLTVVRDTGYFLTETIIIGTIIVSFAPRIKVEARQIEAVFYASLTYLVLSFAIGGHHDLRLFQLLEDSSGGADIESSFDNNQGGLVAPIYAVFFFAIGAKLQFLMAVALSVLGGKRIGILAIAFGVLASLVFRRRALLSDWRARFAALLLCLGAANVFGTNLTSISDYLYQTANTEVDIEAVMLGRHEIGAELSREIANRSPPESLIGFGAGSANKTTTYLTKGRLTLPHNDWLKLLYDYGALGSAVMTVFLALLFSSSSVGAAIALANAVMMTTDNVMVYLYYQFPVVLMLAHSELRESRARRSADEARSLRVNIGWSRDPT
jgi:hypothetical protein